jgi:hypothetical protein
MTGRDFDPARRRLILTGIGIVAAVGTLPWSLPRLATMAEDAVRAELLRALVRDRETAARLGRRYLALQPSEASEQRLVELIIDRRSRTPMRTQVAAAIKRDFAGRRTVVVDGWVLSRAEARLFALTAIG